MNPYAEKYRVFLLGVGSDTEEEMESFCRRLSEKFNIPHPLLRKIVAQCPIILKKNLTRKMADSLARTLRSFGARISVEVKRDLPPLSVEFKDLSPHHLALESSSFGRTSSGIWTVLGRVRNISPQSLGDIWVLIQLFDARDEFLTFEEVPLALNPLPVEAVSPFKAVFERDLAVHRGSIAFKTSSGSLLAAADRRPIPQWSVVRQEEGDEAALSIDLSRRPPPPKPVMPEQEPAAEAAIPSLISLQSAEDEVPSAVGTDLAKSKGTAEAGLEEASPGSEESAPAELELKAEAAVPSPIPPQSEEGATSSPVETLLAGTKETPGAIPEETPRDIEEPIPALMVEPEPPSKPASTMVEEAVLIPPDAGAGPLTHETEERTAPSVDVSIPLFEGEEGSSPDGGTNPLIPGEADRLDTSSFEEASRLIHEISEETESSLFPWIEKFREGIEQCYREHPDPFLQWFRIRQGSSEFKDDFHSILVLLAHARFDQVGETEKALKNTERVFQRLAGPPAALDEIPALEGTLFFSGEQWRELFYRAIPKLHQIGRSIIDRKKGEAFEIQRMVLVIPHMSEKMSRKALWWMSELMPHVMTIDFSNYPVLIDRPLYRVASRLGIVDPHFDVHHGKDSMGALKIQAFAKGVYPREPFKIETPMAWIGRDEAGSHCLPLEPSCEGCLFEGFCQKLYFHFDPSEKGMGRR